MKQINPFDDGGAHLRTFPDATLRDLARNDSAPWKYRKQAVEVLHVRRSPLIKHPDLEPLVHELSIELDGIEFAKPESGPGPLTAGFTIATMFGGEVTDMEVLRKAEMAPKFTGFDEVQITDKPKRKKKDADAVEKT